MSKGEHRAQMHQLAIERRQAGQPIWAWHVRIGGILHNDDIDLVAKRDQLVFRLKHSSWIRDTEPYEPIHEILEEFGDLTREELDQQTFNGMLAQIYDEADYARAWLDTLSVQ